MHVADRALFGIRSVKKQQSIDFALLGLLPVAGGGLSAQSARRTGTGFDAVGLLPQDKISLPSPAAVIAALSERSAC